MNTLALDLGSRHTGVAFSDARVCVGLPLETIHHANEEELLLAVQELVQERTVTRLIVGLPRFLSGEESGQTRYVREVTKMIQEACPQLSVEFLDERMTNPLQKSKDPHAQAALTLLQIALER